MAIEFESAPVVTTDPDVCSGQPVIEGTRIMVSVILDNLAAGLTPAEIAAEYPPLTEAQILSAVAWASRMTQVAWRQSA
jgi:uncharacterized protein (DUF433 family)